MKIEQFAWDFMEGRYNSTIGSSVKAFAAIVAVLSYSNPFLLVLSVGLWFIGIEIQKH